MPGDTAAIHSGSLSANAALPTNSNGDTLVEANSVQEAVGLALVGTITVQHAGETLNYSMAPGNVGATIAEHKPFLYSGGAIQLEDMAGSATGSDWDYNDRSWMASAAEVPGGSSSYSYPTMVWITGGAGTNETSASNGWFVVHRNNTVGGLTVNFGVVASAASNTATLDVDYNILGNGSSVTFAAGASEAMIFIHPMIDALHSFEEPFESPIERVTLALSGGTGYTVYTPNEAFIELGNDNLQFDLDVDADGILGADGIDLAKNYLPGYKDGVAMISTGTRFNVPGYQGQRMKLVLNGIGTASADHVLRVEFIIAQVSADPGYTGNRTDPSLEGAGNTEDYSFRRNGREGMDNAVPSKITINRTSAPSDNLSLHGGPYGGKMELNSTWVNFWCKDYGGAARRGSGRMFTSPM